MMIKNREKQLRKSRDKFWVYIQVIFGNHTGKYEIIERIAKKGKPIFLATGASEINEVKKELAVFDPSIMPQFLRITYDSVLLHLH